MAFIYNTPENQQEMLEAIGAHSLDELFEPIPEELKLQHPLQLPPALSELELDQHLRELAKGNQQEKPKRKLKRVEIQRKRMDTWPAETTEK